MCLDDLALPFRIEQVGIALRCVLRLHQARIVADHLDPGAGGRIGAVGIDLVRREIFGDVVGQIGHEPVLRFPIQVVSRIGGVGDIDRIDTAALLLRDTLVDSLGPGALDAHRDAGIFGLERLAEPFGGIELERRIIGDLAFLARRFDQFRCDAGRRRRGRTRGFREQRSGRDGGRSLE